MNSTNQLQGPFQEALLKAAKVGNIKLMRELIKAGASLFTPDEEERNALSYALAANPEETIKLLEELFPVTSEIANTNSTPPFTKK